MRAAFRFLDHQRWLNTDGRFGTQLELRPKAWGNARTDLVDCDLRGVDFSRALLDDVIFVSCSLRLARFNGAELRKVRFICCELEGCDFTDAILEDISFEQGTNYQQAKFERVSAQHVFDDRPSGSIRGPTLLPPTPL
jgi:uncharacterized protein YjbI with pentapeptide repeats